ncbi:hypothetical protein [Mesorhizobium waimense]|uniref:hypothetical protein n=1 Tax=Mesorhizobium waimense TaxID=1300307 RepID=UPI00142DE411|nr:hypothetical protein [Mesorhizobium waimense]
MTKLSELGPPNLGREPAAELDHFYVCRNCGQLVDRRDLRQVIWHQNPEHERLEFDS